LEDEIPPMPKSHELIGQPNDSQYEKQEKELKDKINAHKNNAKQIREKMEAEKLGIKTPEELKAFEEKKFNKQAASRYES